MKKQLLSALCGLCLISASNITSANISVPHLETSGVGEITVQPDMATFSVAVVEQKSTAKEAKQAVDQAVTAFVQRLQKLGIEHHAIQSANISLQPQYHHNKDKARELKGYQASRNITVTVNDLENLNIYLDHALGDGINRISNIKLAVRDEDKYQEQARQAAITNAKNKARSLAKGFGEQIEGVWKIRYRSNHSRPVAVHSAQKGSSKTSATYQDAEILIRDSVEVIFKLSE